MRHTRQPTTLRPVAGREINGRSERASSSSLFRCRSNPWPPGRPSIDAAQSHFALAYRFSSEPASQVTARVANSALRPSSHPAAASEFDTLEALRADLAKRIGQMNVVQAQLAMRERALDALVGLVEEQLAKLEG